MCTHEPVGSDNFGQLVSDHSQPDQKQTQDECTYDLEEKDHVEGDIG